MWKGEGFECSVVLVSWLLFVEELLEMFANLNNSGKKSMMYIGSDDKKAR